MGWQATVRKQGERKREGMREREREREGGRVGEHIMSLAVRGEQLLAQTH